MVRSWVTSPKPRKAPAASRKAVMATPAQKRVPSLRTRQHSSSQRPPEAAAAKARAGSPAAIPAGGYDREKWAPTASPAV
ncbi:hypothetical protein GCM10020001_089520 [Nonomuraea salmonea]